MPNDARPPAIPLLDIQDGRKIIVPNGLYATTRCSTAAASMPLVQPAGRLASSVFAGNLYPEDTTYKEI